MNTENILKVAAAIAEAPAERFIMGTFLTSVENSHCYTGTRASRTACGTAGCIAGWANLVKFRMVNNPKALTELPTGSFHSIGQHFLGLVGEQSNDLFLMNNLSISEFDELPGDARKAAAVNVLEHLVKTGKVDWRKAIEKTGHKLHCFQYLD